MTGETISFLVGDQPLEVFLQEHPRARRVSVRVDGARRCVVLVKPRRTSRAAALAFALERSDWIMDRLAELAEPVPFAPGVFIPVHGFGHEIVHVPDARRGVWRTDGRLLVSGDAAFLTRRVKDWFKTEARKTFGPVARQFADAVNRQVKNVSVRDQRSRWGSCTADGNLSFSWRLLMAPDYVMEYVIAHEVAHLREMNHSGQFWQTVDRLTDHRAKATQWLASEGLNLHRYGADT
jgi:predicted metal-dependent hydrolase